jgi:fructokinase
VASLRAVVDSAPLIVVAGESLIDRVVRSDATVEALPGGGPFNTARALARLGCRVAFLGALSTDVHGRLLRGALEADGVDLSLAPTSDAATLIATATLDAAGQATYHFEPPASAAAGLAAATLPPETVALHVGTLGLVLEPTATTIADLVAAAPGRVLVMVDPNIRPATIADEATYRARLAAILARADVVKVSRDDLSWLEPGRPPVDAARRLFRRGTGAGASIVLLTDGPNPVLVIGPAGVDEELVPAVAVVDTIGAGDAFGAGFLADWTRSGRGRAELGDRAAVRESVRFATRVAAWTVGRAGADPPALADLGTAREAMP